MPNLMWMTVSRQVTKHAREGTRTRTRACMHRHVYDYMHAYMSACFPTGAIQAYTVQVHFYVLATKPAQRPIGAHSAPLSADAADTYVVTVSLNFLSLADPRHSILTPAEWLAGSFNWLHPRQASMTEAASLPARRHRMAAASTGRCRGRVRVKGSSSPMMRRYTCRSVSVIETQDLTRCI